jgi:hypothetical protein
VSNFSWLAPVVYFGGYDPLAGILAKSEFCKKENRIRVISTQSAKQLKVFFGSTRPTANEIRLGREKQGTNSLFQKKETEPCQF